MYAVGGVRKKVAVVKVKKPENLEHMVIYLD